MVVFRPPQTADASRWRCSFGSIGAEYGASYCKRLAPLDRKYKKGILTMFADEIITRCKNRLETQSTVANSYAGMIEQLDITPPNKVIEANAAIVERWSKSGLTRVKTMAWKIVDKKRRQAIKTQGQYTTN